jgi:predicted DNA-binding transcriptional regulator YafY
MFRPYTLFFSQRAWYAVGLHCGRNEVRSLRLTRFVEATPTDVRYVIPESFSLDKHLGNAWRMIRGKPTANIEIRFDAKFADTIAETHWHKTQSVVWEPDGSIRFRVTVDGFDEIVWWLLSMGPHARVIKPPALASLLRRLAMEMADQYPPAAGGG